MIVDKPFGLTFLDLCLARDVQVSYLKWFGGQPDRRQHFLFVIFLGDRHWWEPLKEGTSTVNADL